MKNRIKNIALIVILPLVVLFQFGQANFIHFHVSEDGRIIAHSHPYQIQDNNNDDENSAPSPGHHHSNSELLVLQLFDGSYEDHIGFNCLEYIKLKEKGTRLFLPTIAKTTPVALHPNTLRGPPSV